MPIGKFYWENRNEEKWVGPHDTREAAVAEACAQLEPGAKFDTALTVPPVSLPLSGEWVCEALMDWAGDNGPEDASQMLNLSNEAERELDALLAEWVKEHDIRPLWWDFAQEMEHEVPGTRASAVPG